MYFLNRFVEIMITVNLVINIGLWISVVAVAIYARKKYMREGKAAYIAECASLLDNEFTVALRKSSGMLSWNCLLCITFSLLMWFLNTEANQTLAVWWLSIIGRYSIAGYVSALLFLFMQLVLLPPIPIKAALLKINGRLRRRMLLWGIASEVLYWILEKTL